MPSEPSEPDLSVVVPVYGGAPWVRDRLTVLNEFLNSSGLTFELILVDDGSPDQAGSILDELANTWSHTRVVHHSSNRGKFAAIRTGMEGARGKTWLFTDSDVPYECTIIPELHDHLRSGFHIAIGDRNLPGSHYAEHLSFLRRLSTRCFTHAIRLFVTSGLEDTQCGIKAVRGDVGRVIYPLLEEVGFAGDVELLYVALKHHLDIKRVPARLIHQAPSTVRPFRDAFRMLRALFRIRRRHRRGTYESQALLNLSIRKYWN